MVNPFVAESLVLLTFIDHEIMETICEKAFRELSSQMAAKILKHKRAEKFHFQNLILKNWKPLLLITLNEQAFTA